MNNECTVNIDGTPFTFPVEGEFFWGKDELLFPQTDNIISKTSWLKDGYAVVNAFTKDEFKKAKDSITESILNVIKSKNIPVDDSFTLEKYHRYVNDKDKHNEVIFTTREFRNDDFDFDIDLLAEKFSEAVGYKLSSHNPDLGRTHVQVRISRPNSYDINPPHRDGYLSYYSNILNVWIPIAGCNEKSSLPIIPGSHLINEKDIYRTEARAAKIIGNVYNVPCILETRYGLNMIRPNPKETEAIIFTPFLIHGAAVNTNADITRVALELRFSRA